MLVKKLFENCYIFYLIKLRISFNTTNFFIQFIELIMVSNKFKTQDGYYACNTAARFSLDQAKSNYLSQNKYGKVYVVLRLSQSSWNPDITNLHFYLNILSRSLHNFRKLVLFDLQTFGLYVKQIFLSFLSVK